MEINTINLINYATMVITDRDELMLTILKSISYLLCDYLGLEHKDANELRHYIYDECIDGSNDQPEATLPTE